MLEVLRTPFGTASSTGLASPTRCSSHLHHIAFDDDRPVFEQPVRSALHDNLGRDAIYRCDALIESNTTVPGLRHESQVPVLCGARQLGPRRRSGPVVHHLRFALLIQNHLRFALLIQNHLRFALLIQNHLRFALLMPNHLRFALLITFVSHF